MHGYVDYMHAYNDPKYQLKSIADLVAVGYSYEEAVIEIDNRPRSIAMDPNDVCTYMHFLCMS